MFQELRNQGVPEHPPGLHNQCSNQQPPKKCEKSEPKRQDLLIPKSKFQKFSKSCKPTSSILRAELLIRNPDQTFASNHTNPIDDPRESIRAPED